APGKDQKRTLLGQPTSLVTSLIRTPMTGRPSSSLLISDPLGRASGLPIDVATLFFFEQRRTILSYVLIRSLGDESRAAMLTPPRSRVSSHPPLAPPVYPLGHDASVEHQVDAIMRELMAKYDQVKSMEVVAKDREEFAFLAEARLSVEERALYFESD
ncbi:MAG: hypothetical protein ACKPKO_59590, partial [Candidatus Fonsibacter sp.]